MGGEHLMKKKMSKAELFLTFLLYFGGLVIALEWFHPIQELLQTDYPMIFVVYALFCFLLTFMQTSVWLSLSLKMTGLLFILNQLFMPSPFLGANWIDRLTEEVNHNFIAISQQNWYHLTEMFQIAMFLLLIALMSYLLYFWLITMKRVFVYVILSFVFVTVMDTFTLYQAHYAIIRLFIVSLFMLVLAHYLKRISQHQLTIQLNNWFSHVIGPLFLSLIIAVLIGYLGPKSEPVWPDPVPFLSNVAERFGGIVNANQRAGYGDDDSELGGSFIQDRTPVFQADAPTEHYWRVESKDYYTGNGWERSTELQFQELRPGEFELFYSYYGGSYQEATVYYMDGFNFDKLVYPYGFSEVEQAQIHYFAHDAVTGIIEPRSASGEFIKEPIHLTYHSPGYTEEQLRRANGGVSGEMRSLYLQLPEELPDRVTELAESIIEGHATQYDQALAIEQYFSQADFSYQTNRVPVPATGQDYVDQFLFESQVGYCDNFSTAMVVMLRSVGIPARWVKGFTSGDMIQDLSTDDQELYRYQITNSHAHSWVEVYFPQIGWVPFEPTIGYSSSDILDEEAGSFESNLPEELNVDEEQEPNQEVDTEEEQEEQNSPIEPVEQNQNQEEQMIEGDSEQQVESSINLTYWLIGFITVVLILAIVNWKKLLRYYLLKRKTHFKHANDFQRAYWLLIRLLYLRGIKRGDSSETLSDYAKKVDQQLGSTAMSELTTHYHQLIYRNDQELVGKPAVYQSYQKMVDIVLA